jgi:putative nucleotidyltransferase with HDIG domain
MAPESMSLKNILRRAQVWDASFDEIDNFRDLNHLIHIIIDRAKKITCDGDFHFFVHSEAKKEYKEELRDDVITIDERNILITYLSLKDEIIYSDKIKSEGLLKESEVTEFILFNKLGLKVIIPFVHSFKLLGFLGIGFKEENSRKLCEKEKKDFMDLKREALLNLNAAILVDKRFAELMVLADLGKEISAKNEASELCDFVFESINKVVDFTGGVLYFSDEKTLTLKLKAAYNTDKDLIPESLEFGQSISGMVAKGGKPLLIKNLNQSGHFMSKNKEEYLCGSVISLPLKTKKHNIGILTIFNSKDHEEFTGENLHLISIFANFASTTLENLRLYDEIEKSYFETVSALVGALDASDAYTKGHSDRVMMYSQEIAKELGVTADKIKMIKFGALLHDIGKIGISEDIIRKPGKLTEEEYHTIMEHPVIGGKILEGIGFLRDARQIVMYHHERLNGSGYPHGLKGKDIPLGVRILQVADVYDALSSKRPYREALSSKESIDIITKDVGTHFDSKVVAAFVEYLKSEKLLNADYIYAPMNKEASEEPDKIL